MSFIFVDKNILGLESDHLNNYNLPFETFILAVLPTAVKGHQNSVSLEPLEGTLEVQKPDIWQELKKY